MSGYVMMFPDTVEEFMEQYKMTDTEHIYSNGTDYVPIFRMRQWFEHQPTIDPVKHGKWVPFSPKSHLYSCSLCGQWADRYWNYCPNCGSAMEGVYDEYEETIGV